MPRISWHSQFWAPDQIWSHLIKECPGELASPSLHLPPAPGYYTALYTRLNFSINEIGLSDIGDIYIFRFVCFCLVFACLKCFDKSPKAEFKEKMQVFSEQNAGEKHEEWWRNDGVFSSRKIQFILLAQQVWKSWSRARFCGISSCCFTYFIFLLKGGGGTVPQEGHNFEFSENDFFDLISYFGPKRHMFFDKTALRRKNPRFYSNF